jgi:hypothetical protein
LPLWALGITDPACRRPGAVERGVHRQRDGVDLVTEASCGGWRSSRRPAGLSASSALPLHHLDRPGDDFTLVVSELAPKRIAMQRAEGWAMLVAQPLVVLPTLSRPVVRLLGSPPTWSYGSPAATRTPPGGSHHRAIGQGLHSERLSRLTLSSRDSGTLRWVARSAGARVAGMTEASRCPPVGFGAFVSRHRAIGA